MIPEIEAQRISTHTHKKKKKKNSRRYTYVIEAEEESPQEAQFLLLSDIWRKKLESAFPGNTDKMINLDNL